MKWFILLFFISLEAFSQEKNYDSLQVSIDPEVQGTLLSPKGENQPPLAILIAGSGPTDRDGNQALFKNNSLKYLAEGLAQKGIATFRYDKRVIAQINNATVQEEKMTFEDEVNDALLVVNHFKDKYKKIILIGHYEGALIGLLVAQKVVVSKFVSISGAGNSSATLIEEQIGKNAPQLKEESQKIISQLRKGELVENISPYLAPVFRKSIQPYLISWFKYEPTKEIVKLQIPILIVQGTNYLQVEDKEAQLLKEAQPKAQLLLIEGMNHVLKKVKTLEENQLSYLNPDLPISGELVEGIASFIK
ncbi:hydrolase, alpha/beta domain protein [Capnocytophaga sp. oral taxon 863 str. F0517]|uniref:alpha/beta hydrolase family protein n=1 Tax=Capnocytophaga sp. oral taxon 863 TaxID=1227265 RepID=UPI0003967BCD|nr:alpha/beta hydrolase [Capnocytophaga sp. oral taxon 863]ERI63669.1 hydrolase, alpha/beta domain protein [Capnocytophaga sp. oral taxon 863 str. F0517]